MNEHIEAAAAAIKARINNERSHTYEDLGQAAYNAIVESLASAGDEGVVEAIRAEIAKHVVVRITDAEQAARAALAVARLSMGEVERNYERLAVAVMEMHHDNIKGDFELPKLARLDLDSCVAVIQDAARAKEAGHE